MISKKEEVVFYEAIYILAFGEEAEFFYSNDIETIYSFLKERFFGDNLQLRITLLSKLLFFDSDLHPQLKADLRIKSQKLSAFTSSPLQE